jgi:hypothetical protein
MGMATLANMLALMGMALIRFDGRGAGGFVLTLFGLAALGIVVWVLKRQGGGESAKK